jgi:hypothetical protein
MRLAVNIGGIPHLAKNERDMGHPSLVREASRMKLINASKLHRKSGGWSLVREPEDRHWRLLVFVRILKHFFLNFHVAELVGVEYLATIQTFDVFNVLFTRYHADFGVLAGGVHLGDLSA